MRICGGFNLAFDSANATPMTLMVHVHPERSLDLIEPQALHAISEHCL